MISIATDLCIGCGKCIRGCPMGVLVPGEKQPQVHPRRRCILCMHCAAGCPGQAIRFSQLSPEAIYPTAPTDPLEALIQTRRSIRHYQKKLPPREVIAQALQTANFAPSGKNQRAMHWTVIWGDEAVRDLRDHCLRLCEEFGEAPELPKLQRLGTDLLTCGAPCMIVAWTPEECLNPILDPAVAMTQLELLLVSKGLSTCWGGYLRQVSDRFPEIRERLGLTPDARVRCALMVGYAKGETYLRPVWRPEPPIVWIGDTP